MYEKLMYSTTHGGQLRKGLKNTNVQLISKTGDINFVGFGI
jgi:hypothetical protein